MLRIIPYLISRKIDGLVGSAKKERGRRGGGVGGGIDQGDALVRMENAFNDCAVMTFVESGTGSASGSGSSVGWPEHPEEHIFDENDEKRGEVL